MEADTCLACVKHASPVPVLLLAMGSFNPVTTAHLSMMDIARDEVESNWSTQPRKSSADSASAAIPKRQVVIGGIFSPVADAYGKRDLLPASTRTDLVRLACHFHSDWLAVDTWEATQATWTRTRLVIEHLQSSLDGLVTEMLTEKRDEIIEEEEESVQSTANGDQAIPAPFTAESGLATKHWLRERFRLFEKKYPITDGQSQGKDGNTPDLSARERIARLLGTRLMVVCGSDLLRSFSTPNLWLEEDLRTILGDYGLICVPRSSVERADVISQSDLLCEYERHILFTPQWLAHGGSSTIARRLFKLGRCVSQFVPDCVAERCYELGLYNARRPEYLLRHISQPVSTGCLARAGGSSTEVAAETPSVHSMATTDIAFPPMMP